MASTITLLGTVTYDLVNSQKVPPGSVPITQTLTISAATSSAQYSPPLFPPSELIKSGFFVGSTPLVTFGLASSSPQNVASSDKSTQRKDHTSPQVDGQSSSPGQEPSEAASTQSSPSHLAVPLATTSSGPSSNSVSQSASSSLPTSSGTAAGASSSRSASANPSASSKTNDIGLKAAVGVLAGVLVLALLAIGFLLFRRRRRSQNAHSVPQTYTDASDPESSTVGALQKGFSDKSGAPGGLAGVSRAELNALPSGLDDKAVYKRFAQLDSSIQDWVVGSFRTGTPVPVDNVDLETATFLGQVSSEWRTLLAGETRGRFLLLRGLVATVLSEAWSSGELIGGAEVSQLAGKVGKGVSTPQSHLWKAQTLALLSSTPASRAARTASIERLTSFLDNSTASLITVPQSTSSALGTRTQRLRGIVTSVSDLALELGQQRVAYEWSTGVDAGRGFDAVAMEDVLQEQSAERLERNRVRAVIFPGVVRWGDEDGRAFDREVVIRKGAVLV